MTTTLAAPSPRAEIRGRAFGVSILAFFAVGWTGWGSSDLISGGPQTVLMLVAAVLSVALATAAWRLYRRSVDAPEGGGPGMGGRFGIIVGVEWLGLGIVSAVLGATGHAHTIPAVICLGVGLHFLPLARLFHVPVYYVAGILLCAAAVATLIVTPLSSVDVLWTALPGFSAALVLYATCVELLRESAGRSA
jgi:hypothetical protein